MGRADILDFIFKGLARLERGERQLPVYLFGPRGIGKSHLVTIGAARATATHPSLRVQTLPEDIAPPVSADELWARMVPELELPEWLAWAQRGSVVDGSPAVLFVEGLDRHLNTLGDVGRKRLRALLDLHPEIWLVATGARLTSHFLGKDEAFYGGFVTIPLNPLSEDEAARLLDHQAGDAAQAHARWVARREALVTLAGGNPRAVIALADAVGAAPGDEVARRLLHVLDLFTPHYQLRVRDLSAAEQRLVSLLTTAPRELGPTDLASRLGGSSSSWSTTAHRLADHGVLTIRQEGRRSWYRITEPLFRYWLEYRTTAPERTRVAWLSQLLERVLGPDEMVLAWTRGDDHAVRAAALDAVRRRPEAQRMAWDGRVSAVTEALAEGGAPDIRSRVTEAVQLGPDAVQAWSLLVTLAAQGQTAGALLGPALSRVGCPNLAGLARALEGRVDVRGLLRGFISSGRREFERAGVLRPTLASASGVALNLLLDRAIGRMDRRGGVWRIKPREAFALAGLPWLRVRFYRYGRLQGHPPLLAQQHLLVASMGADELDLPDLLWVAMVRRDRQLASRLLGLLEAAVSPRLPWCPWPGRLLALDVDVAARIAARWCAREAVLWVGAFSEASDESFDALVDSLAKAQPSPPPVGRTSSYELALSRLAVSAPQRVVGLREALGAEWGRVFLRVEVLVQQLSEGERGPLHPELARVRAALLSDEAM